MKMMLVFLAFLMLPLQAFADGPYPFPIPPDFKNAPYKFACDIPGMSLRRETYYNFADSDARWVVSVDLIDGKEDSVMVSRRDGERVYMRLFLFIDGVWRDQMSLSKDEERVRYESWPSAELPDKEKEKALRDCWNKQTLFEHDNNLQPVAY